MTITVCYTWETIEMMCDQLSEEILKKQQQLFGMAPKWIIPVARGGLIPATLIAHRLGLSIRKMISLSSYSDEGRSRKELQVNSSLPSIDIHEAAQTVIIDDIVDSGETVRFLRHHYPVCSIAALVRKDCALAEPATGGLIFCAACRENIWIEFPWESASQSERDAHRIRIQEAAK